MARMLGRSRSLRILRGGQKETHQQDQSPPVPLPSHPQVDSDRLKAFTPDTNADTRVETADMLQRPKTSGGPTDRGRQFHKKTTPVALDSSQNLIASFPSPTKSSTTLLYAAEINESREGVIGIALGSPTMASHWNSPYSTDFVTSNAGTVTQITSNSPVAGSVEVKQDYPKPKLSRWKSIFKKVQPPPQEQKQNFYQLARSVTPARADSHHDDESTHSSTTTPPEEFRDDAGSSSPPAFKPEIRESRKVAKGQMQPTTETRPRALTHGNLATNQTPKTRTALSRSSSSPQPPMRDPPPVPQLVISGGTQNPPGPLYASPTSLTDKPLLDVAIPTIKMERYSVMFGNLLQSSPDGSTAQSSSLLMRRQGNGEKLKPLNELTVKNNHASHSSELKPQRRATSPSQAPKSPSVTLSLFPQPSASSRAPSPHALSSSRTGRLQRSKTAPAVSPNRRSFSISNAPEVDGKDATQDASVSRKPQASEKAEKFQEVKAPGIDLKATSQFLSPMSMLSPSNSDGSSQPPISPNEPVWEIVSKPLARRPSRKEMREALSSHPANASMEQSSQPSSAPLVSSPMSLGLKPQTPLTADGRTNMPRSADRLHTILSPAKLQGSPREKKEHIATTTVGVARSVSVSRASPRKADLLKPVLITKGAEGSERLVERNALTPTLVELTNRKSQRVQLVDVEDITPQTTPQSGKFNHQDHAS
ncbi:hypothetical protein BU24DRAFT_459309 [Aaosphaeria arxii CBS 175.79]|uniref:Uncharacterized protein n=1 Tax=Aaosphaeria arxii CBS 175.79 TaxID=1450172 RepID=A0A6A5Y346_9PLEO|nr:uncharacterized protein BU24DRAFT_459309 [Aaosphaeria arxii CBS 175.79]KAF2019663.1 hypothetical protein BU24DRAFT_459309 [Aaosphaeria arxii CBS 175.79]